MVEKIRLLITQVSDKFSSLLLVIFAVFLAFSLFKNFVNEKKIDEKISTKEKQVESIRKDNEELEEELEKVKGEEFVEKKLRDKLGLAREGEIVVVLPDDEVLRRFAPKYQEEVEELTPPNWKKWLNLFI